MGKHDEIFERGVEDMDNANVALDEGKVIKAIAYASKGIALPIAGVIKDPSGFAKELISDWLN